MGTEKQVSTISTEKIRFVAKATIAHIVTYMLCGVIAMALFNYYEHVETIGMKSAEEINMLFLLLGQLVRGLLFGIVIWWLRGSIIGKKLAWLKLWAILVIIGIIGVYAPAPGSIEGIIYLVPSPGSELLPPAFILGSIAEITMQPLLFSIIVTWQRK